MKSLEEMFEEIGFTAIRDAEEVDATLEEFTEGLLAIHELIYDRYMQAQSEGQTLYQVLREKF